MTSLGGLLLSVKGLGRTFSMSSRIDVWSARALAVFHDFLAVGQRAEFAVGAVRLLGGGGETLAAILDARATFRGLRKHRRWSPVDVVYFFGYAVTHYHGLPFTLTAARPLALVHGRA